MTKQAVFIPTVSLENEKPIELTHRKQKGWNKIEEVTAKNYLKSADKIVYLGKCAEDGDMFAIYAYGYIMIFKGRLNSGKY